MYCILVLVLLLASCSGVTKVNRHAEKKLRSNRNAIDVIRQQEAKLSDIPIPISSHPIPEQCVCDSTNPQQIMLGYDCALSPQELEKFFNQEMERFGWRYSSAFAGYERLLQYEKPNRVCSISLRPHKNNTGVYIFTGPSHPDCLR